MMPGRIDFSFPGWRALWKALASVLAMWGMFCSSAVAQPANLARDAEAQLRQCGTTFNDLMWTHGINGEIYIHAPARAGREISRDQLDCVERWAATQPRHTFVRPDGRRPDRAIVASKARSCGLRPDRDLRWRAGDGEERAVILDQGATFVQFLCLMQWTDITGAPVGFASEPPTPSSQQGEEGGGSEEQAYNRIAERCGLPSSTFVLVGSDELRIQPPSDASYESVDCALREVRAADLPARDLGFVGNEAPVVAPSRDDHEEGNVFGWSADSSRPAEDNSFARFIVSGSAAAVDEFRRDAEADGWQMEARAVASDTLVFAQFRVPSQPANVENFLDRYLMESPRRLNIAGVVAKAQTP